MTVQKEKVTRRVVCRKCKSDQVVGNKRGYNFKRMFLILFLMVAAFLSLGFFSVYLIHAPVDCNATVVLSVNPASNSVT